MVQHIKFTSYNRDTIVSPYNDQYDFDGGIRLKLVSDFEVSERNWMSTNFNRLLWVKEGGYLHESIKIEDVIRYLNKEDRIIDLDELIVEEEDDGI